MLVILAIIGIPVGLGIAVRMTGSRRVDRGVAFCLALLLLINYLGYAAYLWRHDLLYWKQALPFQLCDWAMVTIIVALLTARRSWSEVSYFWGIGGTFQAVLTPNLRFGFPDLRFISFFVAHSGIIVGVVFLMLTRRLRPYPFSIVRVFAWSEVYFVCALVVDLLTDVNYGFLLHKPEAFSLLSYLSNSWPIYLLQMHGLALVFFIVLYLPFAIYDLIQPAGSPAPAR